MTLGVIAAGVIGAVPPPGNAQSRPTESRTGPTAAPLASLRRPGGMIDQGSYSVTLHADGTVVFDGQAALPLSSICLFGRHLGRITPEETGKIRQAFLDAGYFDFKDSYLLQPVSDHGGAETSFHIGDRSKAVWRYFADPSAPKALEDLERRLDALVKPRWKGWGTSWLSVHQNQDGSWTREELSRQCDPEDGPGCGHARAARGLSPRATTALCLLPLSAISRSNAPLSGKGNLSADAGKKGIAYLLAHASSNDEAGRQDDLRTFTRAWACTALCAHARNQRDASLSAAQSILEALQREQQDDGSWPAPRDLPAGRETATAWAALALRIAGKAGLAIEAQRQTKAAEFLRKRAEALIGDLSREPREAARPGEAVAVAAMAHGARVWAGSAIDPDEDVARDFLTKAEISSDVGRQLDPGFLFFCMKAYQYLEDHKRVWELWRIVEDRKCPTGCRSGSWDPQGWWGQQGERLYMTSLMVLCEVTFYGLPSVLGRE